MIIYNFADAGRNAEARSRAKREGLQDITKALLDARS